MTWWKWFSRISVIVCLGWIVAVTAYSIAHPDLLPRLPLDRFFFAVVCVAPAIPLAGVAALLVRKSRNSGDSLPPLEIPRSWETAIKVAVWAAVAMAFVVLALRLISN